MSDSYQLFPKGSWRISKITGLIRESLRVERFSQRCDRGFQSSAGRACDTSQGRKSSRRVLRSHSINLSSVLFVLVCNKTTENAGRWTGIVFCYRVSLCHFTYKMCRIS